jgi:hypothetical protein
MYPDDCGLWKLTMAGAVCSFCGTHVTIAEYPEYFENYDDVATDHETGQDFPAP